MALLSVFNQLIKRDLLRCGVQSKTVEINGATVHYYDAPGKEQLPPTLLVHGFGDSANTWYQTIIPIARGLGRVVALDYPGVGFSTLPKGKDFETLPELVDTVEQFAKTVLGRPALLVGHSLGGAMSLRLAARQGVRKLKKDDAPLWDAVLAVSPAGAQLTDDQLDELRRGFALDDRAAARALLGRIFSAAPWPLWLIENDIRAIFRSAPVRKLLDSMDPDDFLSPKELAQINIPCLILWGTEERLLPATLVEYYRQNLPPQGTLEVVKGWSHASQMERPDELVERVLRFGQGVLTPALTTR
jgi:pimeloyl-ACP methyl ester carboxylesterase